MLYQHQLAFGLMAGSLIGLISHYFFVRRRIAGRAKKRWQSLPEVAGAPMVSREAIGSLLATAGTSASSNLTWNGQTDTGSDMNGSSMPLPIRPLPTNSGSAAAGLPGPVPLDETFAEKIAIAHQARRAGIQMREMNATPLVAEEHPGRKGALLRHRYVAMRLGARR